ncbi:DUF3515 family protein [Nonomuraea sp. NPDC046570]|uniref:DUF3515 family protein n=1 Tax=Nonomuraea sp. NPDC046570 TaxID=3155255 RepID=UPI0033D4B628
MKSSAAVLLLVLALAGCGGAVQITPPEPEGAAAAACEKLGGLLPRTLDGAAKGETTPASPYVAVWGEAEIALRCGVPRPQRMAPTDQLSEINGVGWYADPTTPTLFTAITGVAYVEVTIARSHTAPSVLVDLAAPINQALPQAG